MIESTFTMKGQWAEIYRGLKIGICCTMAEQNPTTIMQFLKVNIRSTIYVRRQICQCSAYMHQC